jgi:hypothetical protein
VHRHARFRKARKHQPTASACTGWGNTESVELSATVPAVHAGRKRQENGKQKSNDQTRKATMTQENTTAQNPNPLITLSVQIPNDKAWAVADFLKKVSWATIESSYDYQEALRVSDGLKILNECFESAGFVISPAKYYNGTKST